MSHGGLEARTTAFVGRGGAALLRAHALVFALALALTPALAWAGTADAAQRSAAEPLMSAALPWPEALGQLAAQWGQAASPGTPCDDLRRSAALACFDSRGGLALLRQLDRPVLLRLDQPGHRAPRGLLVVGMGDDEVSVLAGGQVVRLPLGRLAEVWRGEFLTLWRAPDVHPGGVPQSVPAALSTWLNRQLQAPAAPGSAPGGQPARPDEWVARLAAFQMAHGLKPDARPGPVTMMALNRRLGIDEPRLQRLGP